MLLFVPQILVSAIRWRLFVADGCGISLVESVRQTLTAAAWNLALPSKLGDFSKAAMLPLGTLKRRAAATRFVVYEKLADVAALLALYGWASSPLAPNRWTQPGGGLLVLVAATALIGISGRGSFRLRQAPMLAALSLTLWSLHLLQFDLFMKSAGVFSPCDVTLSRIPLAIFAGLLPISFWGLGTRDAALVWLFADSAPASTMAVIGALASLRYVIPGLAGLAMLRGFSHPALSRGSMPT